MGEDGAMETDTLTRPACLNCQMTADEIPAAAWWAGVDPAEAICCEAPLR